MKIFEEKSLGLDISPLIFFEREIQKGVVLAVSGGPDSVAMAHAMVKNPQLVDVKKWIIAHLNHGLRGSESQLDLEFTANFTSYLSKLFKKELLFESHTINPISSPPGGLENSLRNQRYSWLDRIAHQHGITWIFTGHTKSDQAETVIMRLLRGSGWKGLQGIQKTRKLGPTTCLCRPLLETSRKQVLEYCEINGLIFRQDSSNQSSRFFRNRVRNHLLPCLAKDFSGDLEDSLASLCRLANHFYHHEYEQALAALKTMEKPPAGRHIVLDLFEIKKLKEPLFIAAMIALWNRERWPVDSMNRGFWETLSGKIRIPGTKVDLPGKISLEVFQRTAVFSKK